VRLSKFIIAIDELNNKSSDHKKVPGKTAGVIKGSITGSIDMSTMKSGHPEVAKISLRYQGSATAGETAGNPFAADSVDVDDDGEPDARLFWYEGRMFYNVMIPSNYVVKNGLNLDLSGSLSAGTSIPEDARYVLGGTNAYTTDTQYLHEEVAGDILFVGKGDW